jgi:hypothetical protein
MRDFCVILQVVLVARGENAIMRRDESPLLSGEAVYR